MLANLLSNALRYTEQGRIRIVGELGEGQVRISVEDTGVGISPADQARIYDEYAVLDNPQRKAGEGTGLGLAICRRLAALAPRRDQPDERARARAAGSPSSCRTRTERIADESPEARPGEQGRRRGARSSSPKTTPTAARPWAASSSGWATASSKPPTVRKPSPCRATSLVSGPS